MGEVSSPCFPSAVMHCLMFVALVCSSEAELGAPSLTLKPFPPSTPSVIAAPTALPVRPFFRPSHLGPDVAARRGIHEEGRGEDLVTNKPLPCHRAPRCAVCTSCMSAWIGRNLAAHRVAWAIQRPPLLVTPLAMTTGSTTNSISFPSGVVNLTDFLAYSISTLCLVIQSIPRMTSLPFDSKTIRFAIKYTPLILIFTFGHNCLAGISPPIELNSI
jgi:hypothetical protein